MDNIFANQTYMMLENAVKGYLNGNGNIEDIIRDIKSASLYGKIETHEEIHLMDMLCLEKAEDIDDGYIEKHDMTTGGIPVELENEERYGDMSYLDNYEEEKEEEESGFLSFLK